jgi:hypothetical protein
MKSPSQDSLYCDNWACPKWRTGMLPLYQPWFENILSLLAKHYDVRNMSVVRNKVLKSACYFQVDRYNQYQSKTGFCAGN